MILDLFERALQKIDPQLRIRQRRYGDIASLFKGTQYLERLTKGEFCVNGYRYSYLDPSKGFSRQWGPIQKRGRKTIVRKLEQRGIIKTMAQRASLLWGIR